MIHVTPRFIKSANASLGLFRGSERSSERRRFQAIIGRRPVAGPRRIRRDIPDDASGRTRQDDDPQGKRQGLVPSSRRIRAGRQGALQRHTLRHAA